MNIDRLPNANDRVRVIATGELGIIDNSGVPHQLDDAGPWQFFVRLDAVSDGRQWRGWYCAGELEVVGDGPASDPESYAGPERRSEPERRALSPPPPRLAALIRACRACRAWHIAETLTIATHEARCELLSLSEYLVRKALGDVEGDEFNGVPYEGVPRIVVESGPNVLRVVANEAEAWALVLECEELVGNGHDVTVDDAGEDFEGMVRITAHTDEARELMRLRTGQAPDNYIIVRSSSGEPYAAVVDRVAAVYVEAGLIVDRNDVGDEMVP